jgi:hypothetical protein
MSEKYFTWRVFVLNLWREGFALLLISERCGQKTYKPSRKIDLDILSLVKFYSLKITALTSRLRPNYFFASVSWNCVIVYMCYLKLAFLQK